MSEIRLIDANALIADYRVCGADCIDYGNCSGHVVMCDSARFRQAINDQPTVEAEPIRYGHWVLLPKKTAPSKIWKCSECNNITVHEYFSQNGYYAYCKDCGARMITDEV